MFQHEIQRFTHTKIKNNKNLNKRNKLFGKQVTLVSLRISPQNMELYLIIAQMFEHDRKKKLNLMRFNYTLIITIQQLLKKYHGFT